MTVLSLLILLATLPSLIDWLFRVALLLASLRERKVEPARTIAKWLIVVPARDEGTLVEATLASLREAQPAGSQTLLLLDGPDPVAAEIAERYGADVVTKPLAGPTKGRALGWLAEEHADRIRSADAILLIDVGTRIPHDFLERFIWPPSAGAVQAFLSGEGEGIGEAAATSETLAQWFEDLGRERLGWSVRLRGTATALLAEHFIDVVPRLITQVEDTELSLLLAAGGQRLFMGPPAVLAFDEKPAIARPAAGQRARWLAGRFELIIRQWRAIVRLLLRRPLEGMAFVFELFGRPLSLTAMLRLLGGAALLVLALTGRASPFEAAFATLLIVSVFFDAALFLRRGLSVGAAARMAGTWILALVLAPRALFQWIKARRS